MQTLRTRRTTNRQAGFTLIELLVVMAIIALLVALVAPRLFGQVAASEVKAAKTQIELLSRALDAYRLDNGRYPAQDEGLNALVAKPPTATNWNGPYLAKRQLPKDPWGGDYQYQRPANKGGVDYDLFSLGSDGKPGGVGDAADLGNW
jgi:general secretion pathway protein G